MCACSCVSICPIFPVLFRRCVLSYNLHINFTFAAVPNQPVAHTRVCVVCALCVRACVFMCMSIADAQRRSAGLTVCLMIFVDNLGSWFESINHSSWNYVTLADFVMPFFLFMVSNCSPPSGFSHQVRVR